MSFRIRIATPDDAEELLGLYAPYVRDTTISFETEVPTVDEFRARIEEHLENTCHLVLEDADAGRAAGFAYNSTFRARPAYRWASETSIAGLQRHLYILVRPNRGTASAPSCSRRLKTSCVHRGFA